MSYKKNIANSFVTKIINIIISFIINIVVARTLGPKGQGYISYFMVIFVTIAANGDLGINQVAIHFIKNPKYKKEEVFQVNITILSFIFVAISIIILLLKNYFYFLYDYNITLILLGLLYILGSFIGNLCTHFFIASERFIKLNYYQISEKGFCLIIILILVLLRILTVETYLVVFVVSLLLRIFIMLKSLGLKYKYNFNVDMIRQEISFGMVAYLAVLFVFLNYKADQFMIKKMIGVADLGIYSIGVTIAELLFLIPSSVATVLLGRLYNVDESNNELNKLTAVTIKYTFYIVLILSIFGYILSPLVIFMYGNSYLPAVDVTRILIVGIVFASIGKVGSSYYYKKEKLQIYLIITFVTLLLNIIMNYILIPKMGINGSALASTISYTVYGLLNIYYFIGIRKFDVNNTLLINYNDLNDLKVLIRKVLLRRKG